jgi:hypothetical protein
MSEDKRKRRWLLLALLLLLGVGYVSYRAFATDPDVEKVKELRQELAAKDLTPEQRRELFGQLREAMGRLSPEQRREAQRAMAEEGRKRMAADMQRYAAMSPAEKTRFLDERIKRTEERRRQAQAGQAPGGSGLRGGPGQAGASAAGTNRPAPSAAERDQRRRQWLDDTTPEFRAQLDQYRKDMQARRQQLGLPATPSPRR